MDFFFEFSLLYKTAGILVGIICKWEFQINATLENDWKNCAEHFESALESYHTFVNITLFCKNKCKNPKETLLFDNTDEELKFYEAKIRITLCLLNCKKSHKDYIEANDFVQKSILQDFENYEPYNYLQLCYFQVRYGKSIFTFKYMYLVCIVQGIISQTREINFALREGRIERYSMALFPK